MYPVIGRTDFHHSSRPTIRTLDTANARGYRDTWGWNLRFSAYWFATSYKWFLLLLAVIPGQVAELVPGGTKNTQWGIVYSVGAIWAIFGPALFGGISDRVQTRFGHRVPFLVAGAALTLVALGVLVAPHSLGQLVVGYLLLQIGDDLATGPYGGMVAESIPVEHRGRASAFIQVLQQTGNVFAAIGTIVFKEPAIAYLSIGVLNIVCAVVTALTIKNLPAREPSSDKTPFFRSWLQPWKDCDFRKVYFAKFLNVLAFGLISNYILYYLTDMFPGYKLFGADFKVAKTATGIVGLTVSVCAVIGAMVATKLVDRLGKKKLIKYAGIMVFLVLVPFGLARNFDVLWALAIPFGVAFGVYVSCDWALASDLLPDKASAGAQMGVWVSALTVPQVVAGQAGRLIDGLNHTSFGLGYMTMIWFSGVLFVLGTLLNTSIKGSD